MTFLHNKQWLKNKCPELRLERNLSGLFLFLKKPYFAGAKFLGKKNRGLLRSIWQIFLRIQAGSWKTTHEVHILHHGTPKGHFSDTPRSQSNHKGTLLGCYFHPSYHYREYHGPNKTNYMSWNNYLAFYFIYLHVYIFVCFYWKSGTSAHTIKHMVPYRLKIRRTMFSTLR